MGSFDRIPIIDIGEINESDGPGINSIVRQIRKAYGTTGFAYIVNHRVAPLLIKQLFQKSVDFHSLPYKEKIKIELNELHRGYIPINTSTDRNSKLAVVTKPNQSESFIMMREADMNDPAVKSGDYLAGPNQWPEGLPGFQEILTSYFDELTHLCHKICRIIALVLGADLKTFASEFNPPTAFLRLIKYPPALANESNDLYGSAPHTDFGCITILAQDETGGLQVKNSQGQWIDVPFIKDSFVMNIGDMLHRWSNGLLISTPHRVINCTGRERYSCPFFFEPNVNVNVSPLPCCINDHRPKQFESIDYGEFLRTELQTGYDRHAVHN